MIVARQTNGLSIGEPAMSETFLPLTSALQRLGSAIDLLDAAATRIANG